MVRLDEWRTDVLRRNLGARLDLNPEAEGGAHDGRSLCVLDLRPECRSRAIHPKAMPVILTEREKWDSWLHEPWTEANVLQRTLRDELLQLEA